MARRRSIGTIDRNRRRRTDHLPYGFDSIPEERQFEAIDWLAAHGVDRILTHGGPADQTIEEHFPRLKELIDYADGRLIILPGGGVTAANAAHVAKELNVSEVHGTKIVELQP